MAPLQQWVIHSLHTGLCTGYTQQTQSYPQLIHLKIKVIHNISTVYADLHTGYPQFINSLYSITLSGWLILDSIVYPESPIYTVYTEYSSDPIVLLQSRQSQVLTVCAVTMWESVSRFSLPRLDRHWAQAESLKTPEKVWKSAIKCDGSAHMSHLKAEPYRSTVIRRV